MFAVIELIFSQVSWYGDDSPGRKHLAHMYINDTIEAELCGMQIPLLNIKFYVLQV